MLPIVFQVNLNLARRNINLPAITGSTSSRSHNDVGPAWQSHFYVDLRGGLRAFIGQNFRKVGSRILAILN